MANSYRIYTEGVWQSQAGNGIIAISNKISSGKIIEIYNVGINVNTSLGATTNFANLFELYRITGIDGGESIPITKLDSASPDVPSGVKVLKLGSITSSDYDNGNYFKRTAYHQSLGNASNGLSKIMGSGLIGNNAQVQYSENLTTATPVILLQNEGVSVMPSSFFRVSCYYRIDCTFVVNISGTDYTYFATNIISVKSKDTPVFTIFNGSTDTVKLLRLNISETGDATTPYFTLVPISGINSASIGDDIRKVDIIKLDSNSPNVSDYIDAYFDVPVLPFGVPDSYLSDASISSPKGMNYLAVKDFTGPLYQVQFCEIYTNTFDSLLTTMACANKTRDANTLWNSNYPIVLNPGEGIAIVSSAENLVNLANVVFLTSWGSYSFILEFNVVSISVTLSLTNLVVGSEVRIYLHNTTTEITGIENSSTTFNYEYQYEAGVYVDIVVMNMGYLYYRINNILLESTDTTIPIQQIADRNYLNP